MSSSSSSLLDSNASSILGASTWNREKASRQIEGQPKWGIGGDLGEASDNNAWTNLSGNEQNSYQMRPTDDGHRSLLRKRAYPTLSYPTQSSPGSNIDQSDKQQTPAIDKKSDLESAVLLDCLTNNFLFAHFLSLRCCIVSSLVGLNDKCNWTVIEFGTIIWTP